MPVTRGDIVLAIMVYGGLALLVLIFIAALIYRRWYYDLDTFFPKGDTPPATRHYLRSQKKKT